MNSVEEQKMTKRLKYLMQCACFECRKSFKRDNISYWSEKEPQIEPLCPECGGEMWWMGRTFKAPKQDDVKQWRKVETLRRNGIDFHSYGSHGLGKFPRLMNEVAPFLERVRRRTEKEGEKLLARISNRRTKQKAKNSL